MGLSGLNLRVLVPYLPALGWGALRWKLRHALKLPRLLPFLLGGLIGLPVGVALLRWAPTPLHGPASIRGLLIRQSRRLARL